MSTWDLLENYEGISDVDKDNCNKDQSEYNISKINVGFIIWMMVNLKVLLCGMPPPIPLPIIIYKCNSLICHIPAKYITI